MVLPKNKGEHSLFPYNMRKRLKTALFISGGGTSACAVLKACLEKKLTQIEPIVISSNPNAKGNQRTAVLGFSPTIIDRTSFATLAKFGNELLSLLQKNKIELIFLQGWIPLIPANVIHAYDGNIVNQHPGPLDPGRIDFGGKGMSTPYRVNCARIAYSWMSGKDNWTQSVTHFVVEEFDMGNLIRTEKMSFPAKKQQLTIASLRKHPQELIETTHEVQKQFYPIEHQNVIATLQLFSDGKAKGFKRKNPLIPSDKIPLVLEAKKLAIELFPSYNL